MQGGDFLINSMIFPDAEPRSGSCVFPLPAIFLIVGLVLCLARGLLGDRPLLTSLQPILPDHFVHCPITASDRSGAEH